jgi:hypothetical protein
MEGIGCFGTWISFIVSFLGVVVPLLSFSFSVEERFDKSSASRMIGRLSSWGREEETL